MNRFRIEGSLLALAFLDLLGFGMLIPDIQIRLDDMGSPGWMIGAVLASMFVVQTLVSPFWGRLSDRIGRKPIVVGCTLISASAMLVYAFAHNPGLILFSRILAGFGAANIAIAQAYVADLDATGSKVAGLGRMGAAVSAGLIAGPAFGGWLSGQGGNWALGLTAASFSAAGALMAALFLPQVAPTARTEKPKGNFDLLKSVPGLGRVFMVIAISWFALATLEGTFGRLIKGNLGYGSREFGIVFAYESVLALIVQSLLVAKIEKRFQITPSLRISYIGMGIGLALFPFAPGMGALLLASTAYAVSSAVANPMASALCSKITPQERQGELFGLMQSARSFGFIVGPIVGGRLFDTWYGAPYMTAAAVCVLAAVAVPKVPHATL